MIPPRFRPHQPTPPPQQVHPNSQANPPNLFQNPSQIQPQMGVLNPQIPMFNGCGMPMFSHPQTRFMTPMNASQPFNQFVDPNFVNNLSTYLNQNMGLLMQNFNPFVQIPSSNYNQMGSCNVPVYANQVPQVMDPQNPTLFQNTQFGILPTNATMHPNSQNQQKFVNTTANLAQGSSTIQPNLQIAPPQQAHFPAPDASQGNFRIENWSNSSQSKWNNNQKSNFTSNPKRDGLYRGSLNSKNMQNGKGKFRSHIKHGVKGYQSEAGMKPEFANSVDQVPVQPRRNLPLNYTAREIQQWREERKKNYPSKPNIEKRVRESMTEPEEIDKIAKLRRQQLKEILEKQVELGCEVAEIPPHYLLDSEKQGEEETKKAFTKRERFQNKKINKRGRFRQNDRFIKKQKIADNESIDVHDQNKRHPLNKREPTLLQKLLSADIKKDKTRLLQVFKFMVMNSFFRDWPEKPLNFPLVMVKEAGSGSEVVERKPILVKAVLKSNDNTSAAEESIIVGDNDEPAAADENGGESNVKDRNNEVDAKAAD